MTLGKCSESLLFDLSPFSAPPRFDLSLFCFLVLGDNSDPDPDPPPSEAAEITSNPTSLTDITAVNFATQQAYDAVAKITPDPELLNGHKIPPLVPNIIDVRIMDHEISATIESEGSISGQKDAAPNKAVPGGP
jgi:hypothetical protein